MTKRDYLNKAMLGFIGLIYGHISFATGGILPQLKGAEGLENGSEGIMEVILNFIKPGLLIVLGAASFGLLVKSINTAVTGLKKAQEEDGSITTMLTYVVTAAIASSFGLILAYLAFHIYNNFDVSQGQSS